MHAVSAARHTQHTRARHKSIMRRYLSLFASSLPSETTARVWDALFHEGPKVRCDAGALCILRY